MVAREESTLCLIQKHTQWAVNLNSSPTAMGPLSFIVRFRQLTHCFSPDVFVALKRLVKVSVWPSTLSCQLPKNRGPVSSLLIPLDDLCSALLCVNVPCPSCWLSVEQVTLQMLNPFRNICAQQNPYFAIFPLVLGWKTSPKSFFFCAVHLPSAPNDLLRGPTSVGKRYLFIFMNVSLLTFMVNRQDLSLLTFIANRQILQQMTVVPSIALKL